jgi:hypothetical protein
MEDDAGIIDNLNTAHGRRARILLDEYLAQGLQEEPAAQPQDIASLLQPNAGDGLQEIIEDRIALYRRALASVGQPDAAMDQAADLMRQELQTYIREKSQQP